MLEILYCSRGNDKGQIKTWLLIDLLRKYFCSHIGADIWFKLLFLPGINTKCVSQVRHCGARLCLRTFNKFIILLGCACISRTGPTPSSVSLWRSPRKSCSTISLRRPHGPPLTPPSNSAGPCRSSRRTATRRRPLPPSTGTFRGHPSRRLPRSLLRPLALRGGPGASR